MIQNRYISEGFIDYFSSKTSIDPSIIVAILGGVFTTSLALLQFLLTNVVVISERKHLPIFSQKLKDITGDNKIEVYLVKDKNPNAFNAGTKALYITSGCFQLLNTNEIIAVLLHEYGHRKKHHVQKDMLFQIVKRTSIFVTIYNFILTYPIFYFGLHGSRFIDYLYTIIVGRRHEYQADRISAEYGYGQHLISAFKKFDKMIRAKVCKSLDESECEIKIKEMLEDDEHPSFVDRINRILVLKIMNLIKKFGYEGIKLSITFLGKFSSFAKKYPNLLMTTLKKVF